MVFKEKAGSRRFAVSLPPLQGKIALNQSLNREEPFRFVGELLNSMGVRVEKCYFLQSDGGRIAVRVVITGHSEVHSLNLAASDAIPFAVYSGCRFYCTKQFISEILDQKLEQPLQQEVVGKPLYLN